MFFQDTFFRKILSRIRKKIRNTRNGLKFSYGMPIGFDVLAGFLRFFVFLRLEKLASYQYLSHFVIRLNMNFGLRWTFVYVGCV